jgi:F-type H+-transporting ATPase subunit delta
MRQFSLALHTLRAWPSRPGPPARAFDVANDDPMMASVAGRYASALFDLAKEQGKISAIEQELGQIQSMMDQSPDMVRLIRSPVFSADDQGKALTAVMAKAGISGLTSNFFKLLAKNRRLFAAADMIKNFRTLSAREQGLVEAEVTSAHALTPEQTTQLSDTLKATAGKNIRIHAKVDSSILGGLIVKIGSRMIDSSLRTKLNSLKTTMKGAN